MSFILSSQEGHVLSLSFNRPERKNALTLQMYEDLSQALNRAAEDPQIRAVVLRAEGDSFTSGNDLNDFMKNPPKGTDSPVFHFLLALVRFPKPLIAQVQGNAVGIGTTMLLHCDLAYCAEDARLSMPFVKLGLVPEGGSSLLVPGLVGHRRAFELLLLGETFDAASAQRFGFVNEVLPQEALGARVAERAAALAALPPVAVQESKRLLRAPIQAELERVMAEEGAAFIQRLHSPEFAQAIMAFFSKKKSKT